MEEQGLSRLNQIGTVRLLSLLGSWLAPLCVLATVGGGCISPSATGPRDGIVSRSSSAERSASSAPRFAQGGPDEKIMKPDPQRFAADWIEAWNSHDLDKILSHYSEDFEITTPMIKVVMGVETGTLRGKESIRRY